MKIRSIDSNAIDAMRLPKIIALNDRLYCCKYSLMKILPVCFMISEAEREGRINKNTTIIDSTSGTLGLGQAIACNIKGYNSIIVSDPAMDSNLIRRIEDLGTKVVIVRKPSPNLGYQGARLERLHELMKKYPDHYWLCQYDNPHNPGAYSEVVELLVESLGRFDILVGPVGSGGSMCGMASYARQLFPGILCIGVDTIGSRLFCRNDGKRVLRGLGNSILPNNLDHSQFDEVHWITASEAYLATRELHRQHSLFMGPTSGAAYMVAKWVSEQNPSAKVVVNFPDEGYRYQGTVYNDSYLKKNGLLIQSTPPSPRFVTHPDEESTCWSAMQWSRRSYHEVMRSIGKEI